MRLMPIFFGEHAAAASARPQKTGIRIPNREPRTPNPEPGTGSLPRRMSSHDSTAGSVVWRVVC